MQHLDPSSENFWKAHPLHNLEEETDHCSIISFYHVIASYVGRLLVLVNIVYGGYDVISTRQDILLLP